MLSMADTGWSLKYAKLKLVWLVIIIFIVLGWGQHYAIASTVAASSDTKFLYCGSRSGKVMVWDLSTLRLDRILDCRKYIANKSVSSLAISPNGRTFITSSRFSSVGVIWDTRKGKRLHQLRGHGGYLTSATFSPDGRYIGTCSAVDSKHDLDWSSAEHTSDGLLSVPWRGRKDDVSRVVILWDSKDGKLLRYMGGHKSDVDAIAFSPDSQFLLTGSNDGTAKLWSVKTGRIKETIGNQPKGVFAVAFSADGHRIALGRGDGSIVVWDRRSSSVLWETPAYSEAVSSIACSRDGRFVLSGYWDGTSILWDAKQGTRVRSLSQLSGRLSVSFLPTNRHAVVATEDGTIDIWDLSSWKQVSLKAEGDDWVCYTPEGFFGASRRGGQLVSVVKELDVFCIDQFAANYNRPDIIMESFGLGTKEMISHFHKYHLKRLHRTGFTEEQLKGDFYVPEALIKNIKQDGKFVELTFDLKDSKYNLKKYNIYINDVPIFGAYGKEIAGKSVLKTERIELTHGKNKIEVTCINEAGAESHRALTSADYNEKVKSDLYYIGFGISEYKDSSLNLEYAAKDAKDLANTFSDMKGEQFSNVHIKTYLNEQVTADNIKKAKDFLENATVDDTFVLFISGHGIHDKNEEAIYYYITHDADIKTLSKTSADFELIENILQGIAPRNKLFLMDTCESGETEEDSQVKYFAMANKKGFRPRTTRAIGVERRDNKKRAYLYNKDRFIYNDLLRRSGTIVFSSSKGGEFSYESDDFKNGFFTAAIINALRTKKADLNNDTYVSTDELRDYVSKTVSKQTEYMQHPTVDRDNIYQKFGFPIVGR